MGTGGSSASWRWVGCCVGPALITMLVAGMATGCTSDSEERRAQEDAGNLGYIEPSPSYGDRQEDAWRSGP